MDIESEATLTAVVAKVKAAILDDEEVAIAQLDARLEPMIDKMVQKLGALVDRLDGATVTVNATFTIRLK